MVGINAVSSALEAAATGTVSWAPCSRSGTQDQSVYWIYNYKRGTFYPFVPAVGRPARDSESASRGSRRRSATSSPVEAELERWFPLWRIPGCVQVRPRSLACATSAWAAGLLASRTAALSGRP